MPITIHLVRHAQGIHNLSREREGTYDPPLTDKGRLQCSALRAAFPHHEKVTRLIASPLTRTLHTCTLGFGPEGGAEIESKVIALPSIQEVSDAPCDIGSEPSHLETEFGKLVDLSRVEVGWNHKPATKSWEEKLGQLQERAIRARVELRDLLKDAGPDEHVVVVSHGAFLHFLTDDCSGIQGARGKQGTPRITRARVRRGKR